MNTPSQAQVRRAIAEAQTIVVKVGSSSLTEPSGHLDPQRLNALVAAIARVRLMGGRVVLVSSGAIAAGFGTLGFDKRPTDVADQQACAAVGQGLLMAQYEAAFARYGLRVGQILITVSDTIAPQQYRNVRRTLDRLLDLGAVYSAPPSEPGSKRISYVPNVEDALAKVQVGGTGSNVGTGGMVTKMEAARVAAVSGIPAVLTCASNAGPAMMGDPVGTAFAPINDRGSSRRLWIGFASHPQGALVADSGAAKAVRGGAASLLAAGVVEVKGDFAAGDAVWVDDEQGNHLAKGLVGFDSEEIPQMLGRNTAQLKRFLGEEYAHPLVHRDNLVLV